MVVDWPQLLQREVDAAATLLRIPPIRAVMEDGDVEAQAIVGLRLIPFGMEFLRGTGKVVAHVAV